MTDSPTQLTYAAAAIDTMVNAASRCRGQRLPLLLFQMAYDAILEIDMAHRQASGPALADFDPLLDAMLHDVLGRWLWHVRHAVRRLDEQGVCGAPLDRLRHCQKEAEGIMASDKAWSEQQRATPPGDEQEGE